MEIIKKTIYVISFCIISSMLACKQETKNSIKQIVQNQDITLVDSININEELKNSSLDFIKQFNYTNRLIEVDIDKKEPNQIIISYSCRGIADFEIKKYKPLFSYTLNDNLFFIYTGAEELLNITFDTTKYTKYNFDICSDPKKSTYIFEDNKMRQDTSGLFPEPFSSLPPASPPPLKKR